MKDLIHIQYVSIQANNLRHLPVAWKVKLIENKLIMDSEVTLEFIDAGWLARKPKQVKAIVNTGLRGTVVTFDIFQEENIYESRKKNSYIRMYTTIQAEMLPIVSDNND